MASSVSWYTRNDFPVFRLCENLENPLVGGRPQSPGKGRLRCLANAPRVERLRALAGAEYRTFYRLGRICPSMVGSVRRTRSRPVRGDRKDRRCGAFPGFGFQRPTSVLQECIYTPALLATIVFFGIDTPVTHGNSPGM